MSKSIMISLLNHSRLLTDVQSVECEHPDLHHTMGIFSCVRFDMKSVSLSIYQALHRLTDACMVRCHQRTLGILGFWHTDHIASQKKKKTFARQ